MQIKNHLLTSPADTRLQSPNMGGVIKPTVIVLHYTASGGEDGQADADYLSRASSRASAHVVVGRNGSIDQIIPFNLRAWHAGESSYKGTKDVNNFSIGIEIDNWGWLKNGKSHAGVSIPPQNVFKGTRSGHSEWEAYPQPQLDAVEQVIAAIVQSYPIKDIVGHEDIAPGRKQDPGPALDDFKAKMRKKYVTDSKPSPTPTPTPTPKASEPDTQKKRTTEALRLREGPGTGYTILSTIPKGTEVTVLATLKSGWSQVKYGGQTGYSSTEYLTKA